MFKEKNFDNEGHSQPTNEDIEAQKRADEHFEKMASYHPPTYDHDEWYMTEIMPLMRQVTEKMREKNVPFYAATLTAHKKEDKSGAWRVACSGYTDKAALGNDYWVPPQIAVFAIGVENSVREMIDAARNFVIHAMKDAAPALFAKFFSEVHNSPADGAEESPIKKRH